MELLIQLFNYPKLESDSIEIITKKLQREYEFKLCFFKNLQNSYIKKVHIFLENPRDKDDFLEIASVYSDKCIFIPFGRQPHYKDFIEYIQINIPENTIICIMNSDILLDPELDINLVNNHVTHTQMFGITRHEFTTDKHEICNKDTCYIIHDYSGSHDIFILRTPLLPNIDLEAINFRQNLFGAEAIFQKTLRNAGYSFKNPCHQIRGFHIHANKVYFESYRVIGDGNDFLEFPCIL